MKFTSALSLALISSAAAFSPAKDAASSPNSATRQDFLKALIAAPLVVVPQAANAAKYGGFGAESPNVLKPSDAIIDDEIFATAAVQKALKDVEGYSDAAKQMLSALKADPQADLGPTIRKKFDFVQLRDSLNILNTAFDEDTQRGTDRLIRLVMQDITELETANRQKEGVVRSERRYDIMVGKLSKLDSSFSDFLAFSK